MPSAFDRMMNTIRPHLPGAIDRSIKQELFLMCREFFKNTNTWREDIPFTILAGTKSVVVTPTAGKINNLLYVMDVNDFPARGLFMTTPGTVQTNYEQTSNTAYVGTFGITVLDPVDVDSFPIVPTALIEQYTEEFVDGMIARMAVQPSKPYTNTALANYHMARFKGGMARARNDKETGNTFGSQRWAFPQGFRV